MTVILETVSYSPPPPPKETMCTSETASTTSGPAYGVEVPPQRPGFGQLRPGRAYLAAAAKIRRAQIAQDPQDDFSRKLGDVHGTSPVMLHFCGKTS